MNGDDLREAARCCLIFILFAAIFAILSAVSRGGEMPLVEQDVELISISHLSTGATLVFFFDFVQGEWTLLEHRHTVPWNEFSLRHAPDGVFLSFFDYQDSCFRVMRANAWVETWDEWDPTGTPGTIWWRNGLEPALKHARGPL